MNNLFSRPALGQNASIGTLYDARTDTFQPHSLLSHQIPPGVVNLQELNDVVVQTCLEETYVKKFEAMNVGLDLAASILSGLVPAEGIGRHLVDRDDVSRRGLQASVYHTVATVQEKLDFMSQDLRSCITPRPLRTSEITHIVVEIDYGAQSIITVNKWLHKNQQQDQVTSDFRQMVQAFANTVKGATQPPNGASPRLGDFDHIAAYSTLLATETIVLTNSDEARQFIDLLPLQIKWHNGKKGNPILYRMLPIQMLSMMNLVRLEGDAMATMPGQDSMKRFIQLCDEFRNTQSPLQTYADFASSNKFCLPPMHQQDIKQRIAELKTAERDFKEAFGRTLHDVRAGSADSERLWQILSEFSQGRRSPRQISTFGKGYGSKVAFVDKMTRLGATYIGFNGIDLSTQIKKRGDVDSFVLFFNENAQRDQDSWSANEAIMLSLLNERRSNTFFAIVDCDATQQRLEKAVVSHYQNGSEVIHDLQEEQQYLAGHCFARRMAGKLETENVQKPLKRRFVKIPCPGHGCSGSLCDWHCQQCRGPLEYGFTDQYIYCDCGRSLYNTFDFKCNDDKHGPGFEQYDESRLRALLETLDPSNYLNILILGETGVGKSTFINAFVNYLGFSTLDEALDNEELHWVIPCSFAIQTMDRSRADNDIGEVRIEVGSRDDERDGSRGKSATQKTQVYPIIVGGTTYRLIDTPGIGDTRGLEFDKANMEDILKTVSGYDHLHGILILLKPNNARLTAQFSFCIKELLTHLHKDATNNVVFGFTNTRVSHYTPGDTLGPLKALLEERPDIGLSLSTQTTYCFDSESFRYLAAAKKGVRLDNKPDFDSSWAKSRSEAELMLQYFRTRHPHAIKSTISLNATRNMILELVKPMTEITQLIRTNIALQEDDVRDLGDHRLTGDKLRAKLNPEKQLLRKKDTSMPRTVCTEKSCVEFKDDGTNNQVMLADYPKPCHGVCYLENVTADVRAHPNLIGCAAFNGNENCQRCSHHWTLHMHILYELEMYREKVLDHGVQKLIQAHQSDTAKRTAAIKGRKQLIAEYEQEHDQIQQAAATFGVWMKANSILPYNDATVAYLAILIKAEQAKIDAGGENNRKVLADLEEDLQKHQELVRVLDESMKSSGKSRLMSQDEIQQIVQRLYDLKHFGKNLETLKIINTEEHERTNRENPHRVKVKYTTRRHVSTSSSSQIPAMSPYHQTHRSNSRTGGHNPVYTTHGSLYRNGSQQQQGAGGSNRYSRIASQPPPQGSMPGSFDTSMPSRRQSGVLPPAYADLEHRSGPPKKGTSSFFSSFNVFR